MSRRSSTFLLFWIPLSLTLAFTLAVLPWPEVLRWLRPHFALLVLLYWLTRFPEAVGMGGAWCVGLFYDGIIGSPLGLHALTFSVCAAVLLLFYPRWRLLPLPQQVFAAVLLSVLEQIITSGSRGMV